MLTTDEHRPLPESADRSGYRCEAIAHTPRDGSTLWLGTHTATTPRLAVRWLRHRALDIADQLDPEAAGPLRSWLADRAEHESALTVLAQGRPYTFALTDDATHYLLSAHPADPG